MSEIAFFAEESSLFAAPYLAKELGARLYVILPRYNDIIIGGNTARTWFKGTEIRADHLIIIGYAALKEFSHFNHKYKSVAFIASESTICRKYEWVNEFLKRKDIPTYSMPDLMKYLTVSAIPVYQTVTVPEFYRGGGKLTINHSPRDADKRKYKGTALITRVLNELKQKYDFHFMVTSNQPHLVSMRMKVISNIFIDQVIYRNIEVPQDRWGGVIAYDGGFGKSGIEAMLLGCCLVTGGVPYDTSKYFPPPPVVWTSGVDLKNDIEKLITDKPYRLKITEDQKIWAQAYLNPHFVAKHITRHL